MYLNRCTVTMVPGSMTLAFITGPCHITKQPYTVIAPYAGIKAWRNGALIQNALPGLSLDDREFLISGTSPDGWKIMFGSEESED